MGCAVARVYNMQRYKNILGESKEMGGKIVRGEEMVVSNRLARQSFRGGQVLTGSDRQ